tara:strand:+ start:88 stop:465 length:378 start_codon:yes stop_codon:yes gene_type:complete
MTDNKKLIEEAMSGLKLIKIKTNKKGIRRTDKNIKKNLYKDVLDPLTKKAIGGSVKSQTDDMTLSPKADLDGDGTFSEYEKKRGMAIQNAMAKNKKPKTADAGTGKFMVKGMGAAIRGGLTKGSS